MCGELVLMQYVIYRHPDDHPRGWVVRAWGIVRGQREPVQGEAAYVDSLSQARAHVPEGSINLGRFASDDPVIYEVWT
jgi:hypothetical protein